MSLLSKHGRRQNRSRLKKSCDCRVHRYSEAISSSILCRPWVSCQQNMQSLSQNTCVVSRSVLKKRWCEKNVLNISIKSLWAASARLKKKSDLIRNYNAIYGIRAQFSWSRLQRRQAAPLGATGPICSSPRGSAALCNFEVWIWRHIA